MANKEFLWYRLGDSGDYHHVGDDISALIEILRDADLGDAIQQCGGGIKSSNYSGNNYISVYWGDKDADLVARISPQEFRQILKRIKE